MNLIHTGGNGPRRTKRRAGQGKKGHKMKAEGTQARRVLALSAPTATRPKKRKARAGTPGCDVVLLVVNFLFSLNCSLPRSLSLSLGSLSVCCFGWPPFPLFPPPFVFLSIFIFRAVHFASSISIFGRGFRRRFYVRHTTKK